MLNIIYYPDFVHFPELSQAFFFFQTMFYGWFIWSWIQTKSTSCICFICVLSLLKFVTVLFLMFSLAIYLLKGMSLRLLIFQIWLFVSSWFYLTCSSISRIPCKIIVRIEAWLKSGSNSLEEYFYKSAIKFVIKHRFTD